MEAKEREPKGCRGHADGGGAEEGEGGSKSKKKTKRLMIFAPKKGGGRFFDIFAPPPPPPQPSPAQQGCPLSFVHPCACCLPISSGAFSHSAGTAPIIT